MKLARGQKEQGVIIGNTYDKYGSANPIVRRLLKDFEGTLIRLVNQANPSSLHEVGCGEGYWTCRFAQMGINSRGTDFSEMVIAMARENASQQNAQVRFEARSIYDLLPEQDSAPLIVCCEVLEHVEDPERAIDSLANVAQPYLIASVPREPLWRVLNLARGKYISSLGNTPGHIQHWSKSSFVKLLQRRFTIEAVCSPLPWTMVLCKSRQSPRVG